MNSEGRVSSCLYGRDPGDCSACQEAQAHVEGRTTSPNDDIEPAMTGAITGRTTSRSLLNYLTGTVPDDPWWMYVANVAILLVCLMLFSAIVAEVTR